MSTLNLPVGPLTSRPRPLRSVPPTAAAGRRPSRMAPARVALDSIAAALGAVAMLIAHGDADPTPLVAAATLLLTWPWAMTVSDRATSALLDPRRPRVKGLALGVVRTTVVVGFASWMVTAELSGAQLLIGTLTTAVLAGGFRLAWWSRRRGRRILVVGHSNLPERFGSLFTTLSAHKRDRIEQVPPHLPTILAKAKQDEVEEVVVVPCSHLDDADLRRLGWQLEQRHQHLHVATGLGDVEAHRTRVANTGGLNLIQVLASDTDSVQRRMCACAGRVVAAVLLLLASPFLIAMGIAVRLDSSGKALFRQVRVGQDGQPFTMFKFRTMTTGSELETCAVNDCDGGVLYKSRKDPRITRVGAVLRKYSLDELPQLLNVLRGEMALVGPRPALPSEVEQWHSDMHRRLAVRPGMTGLWQVSGRSDLPWAETIRLDLSYVDNWSPTLDLRILAMTLPAVVGHRGAY